MGVNLSIKNVPEDKVERLKQRARDNHRSLQGELRAIIDQAAATPKLTVEEFVAKVRASGLRTADESVRMIREDRDR
jgi:plasmid stability protein